MVGEKTNTLLQHRESTVSCTNRAKQNWRDWSHLKSSEHKEGFKPFRLPPCKACAEALQTCSSVASPALYRPGVKFALCI